MLKKSKRGQKGFTLVEIAIVLVIVGLLIGGVLKGAEMIKSGKVKRAGEQLTQMRGAINAYQDKYGLKMPGSGIAPATDNVLADLSGAGLLILSGGGLQNPYGGAVTATYNAGAVAISSAGIPDFAAQRIDAALDDGNALTGDIRAAAAYVTDPATTTEDETATTITLTTK